MGLIDILTQYDAKKESTHASQNCQAWGEGSLKPFPFLS